MQDNASKITYGAMMTALFATMLGISFFIPLIGILMMSFIPLPIILYRLRHDQASTLLVLFVGIVLSTLIGGILIIPLGLAFGVMGFVIGESISLKKTKLYTSMATGLTFLIISILTYVASVMFLNVNVIEGVMTSLREMQQQVTSIMIDVGEAPENFGEQLEEMITFVETSLPSTFILGSFSYAFIIVALNSLVLKRLGQNVPKFPPFRDMRLPVLTVWTYLVVLLLPFLAEIEQGTTLNLAYVNATVIFRTLFLVQGISLILYYMHAMKMPTWVKVISMIMGILLNPITVLLGILDIGLNIRAWIGRDKGN